MSKAVAVAGKWVRQWLASTQAALRTAQIAVYLSNIEIVRLSRPKKKPALYS